MSTKRWGVENIPDLTNKTILITGANSGIGKELTKILARKNATIIMAVRNVYKAQIVSKEISDNYPKARIVLRTLDLASLNSIESFVIDLMTEYDKIDILINNAGVMMCPYSTTENGFEIQMGTNHLGHFALTGLIMHLLEKAKDSRIVTTSSIAHRQGNINLNDINWEKRKYSTVQAYNDSKLANLYFTFELAERIKNKSNSPTVVAAHPGYTDTNLKRHSIFWKIMNPFFAQNVQKGVLPTLRAAFDPKAKPGDYYGPSGFLELTGSPILVKSNQMSHNTQKAIELWIKSEELTGVWY